MWPFDDLTTLERVERQLAIALGKLEALGLTAAQTYLLTKTLEAKMAATQADVDALTSTLDELGGSLRAALSGIQGDLDQLKAAHPSLDLSTVTDKVNTLADLVAQASTIDAENPAPPA